MFAGVALSEKMGGGGGKGGNLRHKVERETNSGEIECRMRSKGKRYYKPFIACKTSSG
jgi:hypothetical protein